jgi:hypothetical protein
VLGKEPVNQSCVGGWKFELGKLLTIHPAHRGAVDRSRFVGEQSALVKPEVYGFLGVGVIQALDKIEHFHIAPEFFMEFASEALLEGFTRFTLATRELP